MLAPLRRVKRVRPDTAAHQLFRTHSHYQDLDWYHSIPPQQPLQGNPLPIPQTRPCSHSFGPLHCTAYRRGTYRSEPECSPTLLWEGQLP
ncbi:hypothetical protein FKM82_013414 [Ascaphus truei]